METILIVVIAAFVVSLMVCLLSNNKKERAIGGFIMIVSSFTILFIIDALFSKAHSADLKPKMFPASEARLIEQELVNAHIRRQTLPSVKTDVYRCEDYDRKIERLVELYDELNRTEMSRQWRLHLGHVWEFSLNFCEDVQSSERFKNAYRLYKEAGNNIRARRAAGKEARRLRLLHANGTSVETEDADGNHQWSYYHGKGDRRLLREAEKWEQLATK